MRHLFLSTTAAAAMLAAAAVVPASAADLPVQAAPMPVPAYAPVPVFTWTGLYIGANAGSAFHVDGDDNARFTAGGTLGANWQIGTFVLGIEGDFNYLDRDFHEEWFGTVRGRVGVAFDRALIYATGGAAFLDSFNHDDVDTYGVVGGGVEFAVADNITVKLEYLHVFVDNDNDNNFFNGNNFNGNNLNGFVNGDDNRDIDIFRAGVNFKFGPGGLFGIF